MIVKTVEETAVPGDVIFASATESHRPVEALGEVGDGRLGWNWPPKTVVAKKLMVEFVRKRVERRRAFGSESRRRPHGAPRRDRGGAQKSGFQQVASKHLALFMLIWSRRGEPVARTRPWPYLSWRGRGVEKRQGDSASDVLSRVVMALGDALTAVLNAASRRR